MKKWKIIRIISIILIILFFINICVDAISCMKMTYPHPMLGIDAYNWIEQFKVDLLFMLIQFGVPLVIVITLLILSTIKIKKSKKLTKKV